jgi:hypothetical protein
VLEVPLEPADLGHETPREGWAPALLEDRVLHPFDRTIRLWTPRMDAGLGAPTSRSVSPKVYERNSDAAVIAWPLHGSATGAPRDP